MVNYIGAVVNVTVKEVPAVRDQFETYYLVQKSRTGYVYVTYHATRYLDDAVRHLDDVTEDFHHHRILDVRSGKVHKIRRPVRD
jgi:hypothetical protein